MGGNFSARIITEGISGHDHLRSLRKPKMLPRPKALVDFEICSEWKGIRSNGRFVITCPTSVNEDVHISGESSVVE